MQSLLLLRWTFRRYVVSSFLFDYTALIDHLLELVETFLEIATLTLVCLTTHNDLVVLADDVPIIAAQISCDIFIYCRTRCYLQPDLRLGVSGVYRLASWP